MAGAAVLVVVGVLIYRVASEPVPDAARPVSKAAPTIEAPSAASTVESVPVEAPIAVPTPEQSREASWRAAREEAIRVQQELRAQELARKSAEQVQAKSVRCIEGQRMKRVENGWVQAGHC